MQVEARHVDAACTGIVQVDRDIDHRRHLHRQTTLVMQADRQRDRIHADPIQRARKCCHVLGYVGQWCGAGVVVHPGIVPART